MKVTLAYSLIEVEDAPLWMDAVGRYKLKVRKTPDELKQERQLRKSMGRKTSPVPYRTEEHSVMERDESDPRKLYFMPGLWPRIKTMLDERGEEYTIVDNRDPAKKPPIDYQALVGVDFRENQDVALAMIATADCGIINTSVGFGKSWLISVLCKCMSSLRIVVATGSVSVVQTNYEYIRKTIPGEVGILTGREDTTNGKRVVVTTLKSLAKIPAEKVDLLLVDECHEIGANQAADVISKFYFARRFGFSASPVRADGSGLVMESLFGPVILNMSYEEAVNAGMVTPMKYVMLPCYKAPEPAIKISPERDFLIKKWSYWCNWFRNKIVASLIRELWNSSDAQILVVVQSLEHAIQLHMLMPWMVVAYYGNMDMAHMRECFPKSKYPNLDLNKYKMSNKQLEITRKAFAKGTLRGVISTLVFRQGVSFSHLKVLVRCDGLTSTIAGIQIPGRLSRLDEGKDFGYLIDFYDGFTPWAKRRSETRATLYDEQGWQQITREELINDLRTKPGDEPDNAAGLVEAGETGCSGAGAETE